MRELVLSGNALSELLPKDLVSKLHEAHLGINRNDFLESDILTSGAFNAYNLFSDMDPLTYLNGEVHLNTTGAVKPCIYQLNEPTSARHWQLYTCAGKGQGQLLVVSVAYFTCFALFPYVCA